MLEIIMSAETTIATEAVNAAEASGGLGMLGINLKIFIAQLVNFLIVLLVLWKWAFKPLARGLEARSEKIERGLKDAEAAEKRLQKIDEERKLVLAKTEKEATKVLEEARHEAETKQKEIIEKAKREVERVVAQGRGSLKQEKEAMVREARKDVVEIAIAAVEKILKEKVDEKKSRSLAEEVVRKLT